MNLPRNIPREWWGSNVTFEQTLRFRCMGTEQHLLRWPVFVYANLPLHNRFLKLRSPLTCFYLTETESCTTNRYSLFREDTLGKGPENLIDAHGWTPDGRAVQRESTLLTSFALKVCAVLSPSLPPRTVRYVGGHYESNSISQRAWDTWVRQVIAGCDVNEIR